MNESKKTPRPFEPQDGRGAGSIDTIADWLRANVDPALKIGDDYTAGQLADDLDDIANSIWSDGIDAMGECA